MIWKLWGINHAIVHASVKWWKTILQLYRKYYPISRLFISLVSKTFWLQFCKLSICQTSGLFLLLWKHTGGFCRKQILPCFLIKFGACFHCNPYIEKPTCTLFKFIIFILFIVLKNKTFDDLVDKIIYSGSLCSWQM